MMLRIGALAAGLIIVVAAVSMTLGGAVVTLIVLGVVAAVQHRRGRRMGAVMGWWTAMIAMTLVVWTAFGVFVTPAEYAKARDGMAQQEQQPAPPLPTFLRDLPGANIPPPRLPASMAGPMFLFSMFLGGQFIGALFGSLTWGGVWLVGYGARGPRPVAPLTEETALPTV
jgi:hypothetical protein